MNKSHTHVNVVLSTDEQAALISLLELAVKHPQSNLNIAQNAVILATKVQQAPPVDDTAKTADGPSKPPTIAE